MARRGAENLPWKYRASNKQLKVQDKRRNWRNDKLLKVSSPTTPLRAALCNASNIFFSDLLISLGYTVRVSPSRDAAKDSNDQNEKTKSVKFQDSTKTTNVSSKPVTNQGGSAGRQLVPGLLLVQQDSKGNFSGNVFVFHHCNIRTILVNTTPKCNNNSEPAAKPNDVLDASQTSSLDDSIGKSNLNVSSGSADSGLSNDGVRPTDQLTYLAQILGFKVRKRLPKWLDFSQRLENLICT